MEYFLLALRRFSDFSSRSRRTEFWYFVLFNIIFSVATAMVDGLLGINILNPLYSLVLLVPGLAVGVRRLHDTGRSGWWYLIGLIPVIGLIVLIVFWAQDSEPGTNQWGRNPKEMGESIEDHLVP